MADEFSYDMLRLHLSTVKTTHQICPHADTFLGYLLSSKQRAELSKLSPSADSRKCSLSPPSLFLFVYLFLSVTPSSPRLLMICCDFKRQNMEIAQRGSGIYFSITSVTNYSAQHAESVAPVDPFPPFILFIWRKGYIVSYTTRCT